VAATVGVGVGGVGVKGATVVAALWAVLLASTPSRSDRLARVCGDTVDTMNVDSRAPACPPFNIALRERRSTVIRRRLDWFSNPGDLFKRKRDHIPNILPIDLYISSLIHKSMHRAHCIMTVSYVLSDTMTTIHISVSNRILV
jgi:hypothetical protein